MSSSLEHFQSTLGNVGLKITVSSLLDLADPCYLQIPEEIRAAAWIAASNQGWKKQGIKMLIKNLMGKRYDEDTADFVLKNMEDSAKKYPNVLDK